MKDQHPVSRFEHDAASLRFWRRVIRSTRGRMPTPYFVFAAEPVAERLATLEALDFGRPVRHWLSFKTQPLKPLLHWWRNAGRPVEVVSEFELRAVLDAGAGVDDILVNGPAKHRWLPGLARPGQRVNFDSPRELAALLPLARRQQWRVGLRLLTREENDPENPGQPTQFGFTPAEVIDAVRRLRRAGLDPETVHFHLRTNVPSAEVYGRALAEAAETCRAANWQPRHLDGGGGVPPPHTRARGGRPFNEQFDAVAMARTYRRMLPQFPDVQEIWLENGRFLTAGSGVLVVTVLDIKERNGTRQVICDGGRTLNALVSNWEQHGVWCLPERQGPSVRSILHGPTCMAFDQLATGDFPAALRPGDRIVWFDAGAYHLSWETHFSHGLAGVWWHDGGNLAVAREPESFEQWWGRWK